MKEYDFNLHPQMMRDLAQEFDPVNFVRGLKLSDPKDIEGMNASFERYGRSLAKKSIQMGEERPDRIYEVMKEVIEETGEMKFPLVPQRYIEIAYLSTQSFKRLWIISNSPKVFSYRLSECSVYNGIRNEYGEEAVSKMTCKSTCLAIIDEIFSYFGLKINFSQESSMSNDGNCQFKIEKS